jgi:hypothetical protein
MLIITQSPTYSTYSAQTNVKMQIQRNSLSVISAYLPVLRSGDFQALSDTVYSIVVQRLELEFSLEELLNVFFMFIGLVRRHTQRTDPTAVDGNAALQDLAQELTLLTTIILTEHYRQRTATAEPTEDAIGEKSGTEEAMTLSAREYQTLLDHYRQRGDTQVAQARLCAARPPLCRHRLPCDQKPMTVRITAPNSSHDQKRTRVASLGLQELESKYGASYRISGRNYVESRYVLEAGAMVGTRYRIVKYIASGSGCCNTVQSWHAQQRCMCV